MYDVIIIGGGPAGSTLGRSLSSQGLDVLIIEKSKFPRYKTCAGGIPLRLETITGIFPYERRFDQIVLKKGSRIWRLKIAEPIVTVRRQDFDYELLMKAKKSGVKIIQETVRRIDKNQVFTDRKVYWGRIIVGADGAFSVVRKAMGINFKRWIDTVEWELPIRSDEFIVSIGPGPGYSWFWPKKEVVAFGAGGFGDVYQRSAYLQNSLKIDIDAKEYHYRYLIWEEGIRAKNNMVIIGDAGAFASPLTGAGIYTGILSALAASRMIINTLRYREPFVDPSFRVLNPVFKPAATIAYFLYSVPNVAIDIVKRLISDYFGRQNCYLRMLRSLWRCT